MTGSDARTNRRWSLADITRGRCVTRMVHESAPQTPEQIDVVHARPARSH